MIGLCSEKYKNFPKTRLELETFHTHPEHLTTEADTQLSHFLAQLNAYIQPAYGPTLKAQYF